MKRFMAVVLVLVMMFSALPVLADNAAQEVLLKIKEKIDIPEELGEFHYSENKYDDVLRYDFSWSNEDYTKEMYVSSDSQGRIVVYDYNERTDYSADRTLINYTLSNAQPLAEEYAKRFFPEYFVDEIDKLVLNEEKTTTSYSGRYKIFYFTFDRIYSGIAVESNYVSVRVRATKDKIYVQSVSASLDEDAEFINAEKLFNAEKRQEKYEEKFPITLYYASDYSGKEPTVKLFYSIDKGYISYATGEIVTKKWFDRYAGVTEDSAEDMGAGNSLMSKNEAVLSPKEQSEIDKMESLIKPEEVEKTLRGLTLLKVTDDMVFSESYTYKNDDKYFVSFTLEGEKRYVNTTYNGETGEILSIYSYFTKYDEAEEDSTEKQYVAPEEDIKEFATLLAGAKLDETEIEFTVSGERSSMNAKRMVNNVPFPENSINVNFDLKNNMVTRYSISWKDDVSDFPKPKEAISLDTARKIIFNIAPLNDVYVKQEEGYIRAVTAEKDVTIDAVKGEELYKSINTKTVYKDIESHWARDYINTLWEHDIYLEGEKFNPDEAINQADMIRLFSACRDSGIIPIGWTKERIATYALDNGYVEIAEPDKTMTRREGFKAMATILGYGDITEFNIYKSSYSDMEPNGSAEILKAMGVLVGDTARPEDNLSRAEAAVMVYRYLSK